MSEFLLFEKIIAMSKSENWQDAKKEWELIHIMMSDVPETCLCGHHPIKELCFMRNTTTRHETIVGNCCVNKFFDIKLDKIFSAIKRNRLNEELIRYAYNHYIINDWEKDFLLTVYKKRKFSMKQYDIYSVLKNRIINKITHSR